MTRNLPCPKFSKHRSNGTFVDFSFQCELELEDWYRAKSKFNWNRPKSCSASESLVVSSNPRSEPETAKTPFFLEESLEKVTFWHFEETTNLILVALILVDTSWHWLDTGLFCSGSVRRPAHDGWRHWYWHYIKLMGLFKNPIGNLR